MQEAISFFRWIKIGRHTNSTSTVFIFGFSLFLLSASANSYSQSYPLLKDKYVNDYAGLLTRKNRSRIRELLFKQNKRSKRFMTLLTIKSLSVYGSSLTIESFATRVFNQWRIGNALKNNGILILISKKDHKLRIELGKGYGRGRDASMKLIIDTVMVPRFKLNRFSEGIESGIKEIDVVLDFPPDPVISGLVRSEPLQSRLRRFFEGVPWWIYTIIGILGFFEIRKQAKFVLRNRIRKCKRCKSKMKRLGDKREDLYLDKGSLLEEAINSVDYDVWLCRSCNHILIKRYLQNAAYDACPQCSYHTLDADHHIVEAATEYSKGKEQIDYHCLQCEFKKTEYAVIPALDLLDYSDYSDGGFSAGFSDSDFGGSSDGGGASGSW